MKRAGLTLALTATIAVAIESAPMAHAGDWALNGTYAATSNGDWAQTNDVYRTEASVRSTWTISMTCSNTVICAGRVTSDAGWSADIASTGTEYVIKRDVPNWEPCPDGRFVTGHQSYLFYPVDVSGYVNPGSDTFGGYDKTTGESGGCGLSDKLEVALPFRLVKVV